MFVIVFFFGMLWASTPAYALLASQSDGGRMPYRGESDGSAPHVYTSDNLDAIEKIHYISAIPDCRCVATADLQKLNQVDYLFFTEHVYSYAFYVNDGEIQQRRHCDLSPAQIAARTDLRVNRLGPVGSAQSGNDSFWEDRIEGVALHRGMRDFYGNKYIAANWDRIYSTDKSGGFLYVQGDVEMRPCMLFPWYAPWIYNDHSVRHRVDLVAEGAWLPYMTPDAMAMFLDIVDAMHADGVLRPKHADNLDDNRDKAGKLSVFSFHALFVPHRFAHEFLVMVGYFADTELCAYMYVPFILQALFDKDEWLYFSRENKNGTIQLAESPLLASCDGETVAEMDTDTRAAGDLYWHAYSACGGGVLVVIEHAIQVVEVYTGESIYTILFYLCMAVLIMLVVYSLRVPIRQCVLITWYRRWPKRTQKRKQERYEAMDALTADHKRRASGSDVASGSGSGDEDDDVLMIN